MISLARFLNAEADPAGPAYLGAISLLIGAIGANALDYNREDYKSFRADLEAIHARLTPAAPIPEVLVLVGEVIKTLQLYNRQTASKLGRQFSELQGIISTFSSALERMVSASDISLDRLRELQARLTSAENIDDLRSLKTHLSECLNEMASEVESHKHQTTEGVAIFTQGAEQLEANAKDLQRQRGTDRVTGLPARADAEAALGRAARLPHPAMAGIFVLKRFKQISTRFGADVADSLLERLSTYLGSSNPEDALYRWTGPALLAVMRRADSLERVRQHLSRVIAALPQNEVTIGSRTAIIPVSVGWVVFPISPPVDRLIRQLETFADSQT